MIYVAYGSNLNKAQMAIRCPKAKCLGSWTLDGWRWVFRGVADMVKDDTSLCHVGLWRITDECEKALDRYEGFPSLYRKHYFEPLEGEPMMAYLMNSTEVAMPYGGYFDGISEGYDDFGLPKSFLGEALDWTLANEQRNWNISSTEKLRRLVK